VREGDAFTVRQRAVIADVLAEASALLGSGASDLVLPRGAAEGLGLAAEPFGLAADVTYGQAREAIAGSGDVKMARDFTRAVLALRRDPRAQGEDLCLDAAGSGPNRACVVNRRGGQGTPPAP
jgi:hypothetical protein